MLEASGATRPGMFARGQIVTGVFSNVLLAPKDAIEERYGTKMVFAVETKMVAPTSDKNTKEPTKPKRITVAKRHDVRVVRQNRHYVQIEVEDNLGAGDLLVTRGRQNLDDGSVIATDENGS